MNQTKLLAEYLPLVQSQIIVPNHGHYSVTLRETEGSNKVLNELLKEKINNNDSKAKLHFGWGSYRNFDIMASRHSDYAIIADVSLRQFDMWHTTFGVLRQVNSPKEFIEFFSTIIRKNPRPRFPQKSGYSFKEWLSIDLQREMSWLSNMDSFLHIKNLVLQDKIEIISCDIRDRVQYDEKYFFTLLSDLFKKMQIDEFAFLDTLYVSNLPWMMKNESGFFGEIHTEGSYNAQFPGYSMMLENLKMITPLFKKVISAHKLASNSSPDSVQWKTELFEPNEFILELLKDVEPNEYPLHR
jgi:hypothetical protein